MRHDLRARRDADGELVRLQVFPQRGQCGTQEYLASTYWANIGPPSLFVGFGERCPFGPAKIRLHTTGIHGVPGRLPGVAPERLRG